MKKGGGEEGRGGRREGKEQNLNGHNKKKVAVMIN